DRLRTAAETVSLVVTLLAHGCPVQAMVAAFGFDERTIADWWTRSGRQGQAVHASLVKQTPCGRTRILARCIPWSHRDILGSQSPACRPDTHDETGPRQPPHQ